jgi:hypothetical protein
LPESNPSPAVLATPRLTRTLLAREVRRAAAAFGIYFLLRPVWEWTGPKAVYRAIVVGVAEKVVIATQHFPVVATLSNLTTQNIDFVVLLALSLMLVSTRVGWPRRLRLFGTALAVIIGLQIFGCFLAVMMAATYDIENKQRILLLLPWEFRVVARVKYAVYDVGLPAMMFALFLVTCIWNSGLAVSGLADPGSNSRKGEPRARRSFGRSLKALAFGLGVALVSTSGWWIWDRCRESDPRHVEAHAKVGHLFWAKGDKTTAEEQYRIAVAGGTVDPEVFYNLAGVAARQGRLDESKRLLGRCAELSADPAWNTRVERALVLVQSARPGQVLVPRSASGTGAASTSANPARPD